MKRATTSHAIHDDGSYTNTSSAATVPVGKSKFEEFKAAIKVNTAVHVEGELKGYAYCIYPEGVWAKPRRNTSPDMNQCVFVPWADIKKSMEA